MGTRPRERALAAHGRTLSLRAALQRGAPATALSRVPSIVRGQTRDLPRDQACDATNTYTMGRSRTTTLTSAACVVASLFQAQETPHTNLPCAALPHM